MSNSNRVRIWSGEHQCWWRNNGSGYTKNPEEAGLYTPVEATHWLLNCGPEKKLEAQILTLEQIAQMDEARSCLVRYETLQKLLRP